MYVCVYIIYVCVCVCACELYVHTYNTIHFIIIINFIMNVIIWSEFNDKRYKKKGGGGKKKRERKRKERKERRGMFLIPLPQNRSFFCRKNKLTSVKVTLILKCLKIRHILLIRTVMCQYYNER